jgi:predicted nucleic acid-binding protein
VTTLIDSSVPLDILAPSPWRQCSEKHVAEPADDGEVAINQVIYAKVAVAFATRGALERALQGAAIKRLALPWASAWLVAHSFRSYRRAGGPRTLPLSDFFIGAHAQTAGLTLLTCDPARVNTYFPDVTLIAPAPDNAPPICDHIGGSPPLASLGESSRADALSPAPIDAIHGDAWSCSRPGSRSHRCASRPRSSTDARSSHTATRASGSIGRRVASGRSPG